jgi:hypothetical protein
MSREEYGRWMSAFRVNNTGVQRSFDDLASALASENISRRRALKLAGASLLGAAGAGERCPGGSYVSPPWGRLPEEMQEHQERMLLHQDGFGP